MSAGATWDDVDDLALDGEDLDDGEDPAVVIEDVETFSKVPDALNFDTGISPLAIRIFITLYSHGTKPRRCFPSNKRIGELIGVSGRSVARPLLELLEKGWVRRFPRKTKAGMRTSNGYALALDPARARHNAAAFERGNEPEPLRRGRLAATAAASAHTSANGEDVLPSALRSADRPRSSARAVRATQREELDQENQTKRTRENTARAPTGSGTTDPVVEAGADAGVHARVSETRIPAPLRPSSGTARVDGPEAGSDTNGSLFGSVGSQADACAAPPDSAAPPHSSGPAGADDPDFVRIWTAGPKRGARKAALTAWRRARRSASVGVIEAGWMAHVAEWATWPDRDRQFIPHASTWLNEARWADPPEPRYSRALTPVRREDPLEQVDRETEQLRQQIESGAITAEKLFPRQARLARQEAAQSGRRTA